MHKLQVAIDGSALAESCTECNLHSPACMSTAAPFHLEPPSMNACGSGLVWTGTTSSELRGVASNNRHLSCRQSALAASISAHHHYHPRRATTMLHQRVASSTVSGRTVLPSRPLSARVSRRVVSARASADGASMMVHSWLRIRHARPCAHARPILHVCVHRSGSVV